MAPSEERDGDIPPPLPPIFRCRKLRPRALIMPTARCKSLSHELPCKPDACVPKISPTMVRNADQGRLPAIEGPNRLPSFRLIGWTIVLGLISLRDFVSDYRNLLIPIPKLDSKSSTFTAQANERRGGMRITCG